MVNVAPPPAEVAPVVNVAAEERSTPHEADTSPARLTTATLLLRIIVIACPDVLDVTTTTMFVKKLGRMELISESHAERGSASAR